MTLTMLHGDSLTYPFAGSGIMLTEAKSPVTIGSPPETVKDSDRV